MKAILAITLLIGFLEGGCQTLPQACVTTMVGCNTAPPPVIK
jgi:hypothetical protein